MILMAGPFIRLRTLNYLETAATITGHSTVFRALRNLHLECLGVVHLEI